ncbi:hypothetical protein WCD84_13375 [Luteimonas sp. MJ145]
MNLRNIAISICALMVLCAPGLSHGQATGPAMGAFNLHFTDDLVRKCAASYPATAAGITGSFESMKRRNSSYLSASDWDDIRRKNREVALAQPERNEYINEIVTDRSCALVLEQLSVGGELDRHIARHFPKIYGP